MKIKWDLITYICFILIIASLLVFATYNILNNVNSCTSDPLKYGVNKIRYDRDAQVVHGKIFVIANGSMVTWEFGDQNIIDFWNDNLTIS